MAASSLDVGGRRPLILLVEDEVLARMAMATLLDRAGFQILPVASAEEALEVLAAYPDIRAVVTDVGLSQDGLTGFELARRIQAEQGIGVLVMSGRVSPEPGDLPPGVGFIAKPIHGPTLVHLVRGLVGSDGPSNQPHESRTAPERVADDLTLTPRQQEVLALLVQGKSNRDIAEALGLSENTVKVHLVAIFRTLGVSSRTEAFLAGMKALRQTS